MTGSGGRSPAQWRAIGWLPGYEISEDGDVRHTTRKPTRPAGYVLKGCIDNQGYRKFKLIVGGKNIQAKAHRLVCEAFHGPAPFGKPEVAHCDGSRANNYCTNLRWASRKENDADRVAHGTGPQGEGNPRARLTWGDVNSIRARWDGTNKHIGKLAYEYGLTGSGMAGVCRGRTWRNG